MEKTEFLKQLEDMLDLAPGALKPETALAEVKDWDSMTIMGVIALAAEAGVELLPDQFAGLETVDDVFRLASGAE